MKKEYLIVTKKLVQSGLSQVKRTLSLKMS
jgi:hypothetical protein